MGAPPSVEAHFGGSEACGAKYHYGCQCTRLAPAPLTRHAQCLFQRSFSPPDLQHTHGRRTCLHPLLQGQLPLRSNDGAIVEQVLFDAAQWGDRDPQARVLQVEQSVAEGLADKRQANARPVQPEDSRIVRDSRYVEE